MRLESLRITNFKSLKDATFTPESLAVVVGPNNSGKSNLASAFKFLSEVYEYGLETAVRRSGGYENIAFRRKKRSKAAIEFEVLIKIEDERKIPFKFRTQIFSEKVLGNQMQAPFHFQHKFSIQATQQNINADFKIVDERFAFYSENGGQIIYHLQITRKPDGDLDTKLPLLGIFSSIGTKQLEVAQYFSVKDEQSLLTDSFYFDRNIPFKSIIRNWSVYQFNPSTVRSEGVPTPNPTIDRYGNNLPALVDWLSKKHKKEWETVLNAIRIIIP
ncbi:MAG: AAA family ATPase [Bacteroidota bacterium]